MPSTSPALMFRRPVLTTLAAAAAFMSGFVGSAAHAEAWPNKPVRMVVPYPGGGGVDVLARVLAQGLSEKWKQPVTIDLKPGANTLIGADSVAKANDGHTLLFTTDATFTINPYLYTKLPYDPVKDFTPVTMLVSFSQLLVANVNFEANNLKDLIAMAKARPGTLAYASYGPGSQPHLAMEMFKHEAQVDINHVPYRGVAPALNAVLANEIPLTWSGVSSAQVHLKAGTMKALAYAGKARLKDFPTVPTFAEMGYPAVDANVWIGVFTPSSQPAAQVQQINTDIQAVLADPEFQAKQVAARGYEPSGLGPADFAKYIQAELRSRADLVKISGAKVE